MRAVIDALTTAGIPWNQPHTGGDPMTVNQEPQFTISEFRCAIEVVKLGHADDVPEPLRALAEEIVRESEYVYRITEADLDAYFDDCPEVDDQRREFFKARARTHIEKADAFGESLHICLDLAFTDALGESKEADA